VAEWQGDAPAAGALVAEALATARAAGDARETAWSLVHLGNWHLRRGDTTAARAALAAGLASSHQRRDAAGVGRALTGLGLAATAEGDYGTAHACLREALEARQQLGAVRRETHFALSVLARAEGDAVGAATWCRVFLAATRRAGDRWPLGAALVQYAGCCVGQGRHAAAARFFGATEAWHAGVRNVLPRFAARQLERDLAAARAGLGAAAFGAAWAAGRTLTLEQAVADALEEAPDTA
jgi:tetratricopeptide (TPR) repeat protein